MLLSPSPDMVKVAAAAIRALLTPSQAASNDGPATAASLVGPDAEALMAEMGRAFTPLATTALMGLMAMGEIGGRAAVDDTRALLRGPGQGQGRAESDEGLLI